MIVYLSSASGQCSPLRISRTKNMKNKRISASCTKLLFFYDCHKGFPFFHSRLTYILMC